ncbi:hypothetical protein RRG08_066367 [Elysia crispata]|uniref:Uncharacterized protein n=1 Tax=Elysia crispata TaxID=231223 RepID=A0AAE0YAF1_9GAST|nr:hypothetical protein RRG08_066367 [Elysia crispata]
MTQEAEKSTKTRRSSSSSYSSSSSSSPAPKRQNRRVSLPEPRVSRSVSPGKVLSSGEDMERAILNSSTADPPLEEREGGEGKTNSSPLKRSWLLMKR